MKTEERIGNQLSGAASPGEPRQLWGQAQRPVYRFLRGYAFDPTLSIDLDTAAINEVLFPVEWEDLSPGPAGEYLEVIDYDPASARLYPPVDLDHPHVLAQDGLAPSDSNPQFHQQMVYAVAMTTIANFERALGRKMLWAPRLDKDGHEHKEGRENERQDASFVQRLRIFPHALRQGNAYYNSAAKALLFGYFPAAPADPGLHLPGGTVFTCLSHDIIAHETTHALLDGMHRRFVEPTNPDVRAFHEAFADIVALFQHFSFPSVLRHQIALTCGDLATENLLGQIAQQFGAGSGRYGSLRDALGEVNPATGKWEPHKPDPTALDKLLAPHHRGAILVAAVFDAFLTIYKSRVADLLRIASNGTGVLPDGALHPDLVNRLADEAAKAAKHVLQICIRAIDYLPPVDVTFGEYLRAIITADCDAVPYDDRSYRIAFIEAFRRRGIYPRDVRSLSVESLRWAEVEEPKEVRKKFQQLGSKLLRNFLHAKTQEEMAQTSDGTSSSEGGQLETWNAQDRRIIFAETRRIRALLNEELRRLFDTREGDEQQSRITGIIMSNKHPLFDGPDGLKRKQLLRLKLDGGKLDSEAPKEEDLLKARPTFDVHTLRLAQRVTPDGKLLRQFIIGIIQTRKSGFRGGCTLIIDADSFDVKYAISKRALSDSRLRREQQYRAYVAGSSIHSTYLGEHGGRGPFALLHSAHDEL
jgi:hypothetical protein